MLVYLIQGDVCFMLLCVLRVSKIFKIRLVGRSSLSGTSLSFSTIKFLVSELILLFGVFPKSFLYYQNHFFQFLICQSIYKNLPEIISSFFWNLFPLFCEYNLIFICSKLSYHALQIIYLGSPCSIMSLINFSEFLELSE